MIGIGFDIHRLVKGRPLILGGVKIDFPKGLLGHSDGDVLLHAVCDALLGAIGRGDIGDYFPDTDPRWEGYESSYFLKEVLKRVTRQKKKIAHLDTIIFAEAPILGKLKLKIKKHLAELLGLSQNQVNIKAKTLEGLGFVGKEKALAAFAVVYLAKKNR